MIGITRVDYEWLRMTRDDFDDYIWTTNDD